MMSKALFVYEKNLNLHFKKRSVSCEEKKSSSTNPPFSARPCNAMATTVYVQIEYLDFWLVLHAEFVPAL